MGVPIGASTVGAGACGGWARLALIVIKGQPCQVAGAVQEAAEDVPDDSSDTNCKHRSINIVSFQVGNIHL